MDGPSFVQNQSNFLTYMLNHSHWLKMCYLVLFVNRKGIAVPISLYEKLHGWSTGTLEERNKATSHSIITYDGNDKFMFQLITFMLSKNMSTWPSILNAFAGLSATWVFDLVYPKESVKTLTFLQKFVAKVEDDWKTPESILSFASKVL